MSSDSCLLGIDIGSTTTRAVCFDLAGKPLAEAHREPPVHHPQTDWTEVSGDDWWQAVAEVVTSVTAEIDPSRICVVGLCGLQHALVPLDEEGSVLARSQLWMDQRCRPQVQWMNTECRPLLEAVRGKGASVSTTLSAPKLRWITENDPDLIERTRLFLPVKDFIRYRLTGAIATDPSDARSTALLDGDSGNWSSDIVEAVGITLDVLPPILDPNAIAGHVTDAAAIQTGLSPGTQVAVGSGDVTCTRLGSNTHIDGGVCLYLGTSAWIAASPRGSEGRRTFGATATTGAALKWVSNLFRSPDATPAEGYAALLAAAQEVPPGARGLLFLPHLMGERGPRYIPEAVATFYGLTLAHGRAEMARAVLEGCACHLRQIIEDRGLADVEEAVVVGGGARSALWLQILADTLGMTLNVPRVVDAGALGAAIVAGVAAGLYEEADATAAEMAKITRAVSPRSERRAFYDDLYGRFLDLESRVSPLYDSSV